MDKIASDFEAAVELFHYCGHLTTLEPKPVDEKLCNTWRFIAARHGAISLGSLTEIGHAINNNLNKCPTLMGMVRMESKKEAQDTFAAAFPDATGIRHIAAHSGELSRKSVEIQKHLVTAATGEKLEPFYKLEDGASIFVDGDLHGEKFVGTFKEKVVSYSLNSASVEAIKAVRDLYFAAFEPASMATFTAWRENHSSMMVPAESKLNEPSK